MNVVPRARFEEVLDERDAARAERDAAVTKLAAIRAFHSPDMSHWKDGTQPGTGIGTCRGCRIDGIADRYWVNCPTLAALDGPTPPEQTP